MNSARKAWDKMLYMLGFDSNDTEEQLLNEESDNINNSKKPNIVGLPTQQQVKVIVIEPKSFEEVQGISDHLKNKKQVIVNLDHTDREISQRLVDFLSGVTYALNGGMQKIGNNIFMFTPSNVIITGETKVPAGKVVNINWDKNIKGE